LWQVSRFIPSANAWRISLFIDVENGRFGTKRKQKGSYKLFLRMHLVKEVLRLTAAGLSQRQIARSLHLSHGAVGKYLGFFKRTEHLANRRANTLTGEVCEAQIFVAVLGAGRGGDELAINQWQLWEFPIQTYRHS
jgi:hypothetical protein